MAHPGGISNVARLPSAAGSVNATLVKGAPARLVHINGHNARAGVVFLKLYDKATEPVVGTDVPKMTIALAASSPFRIEFDAGVAFPTGLGYGFTTAAADNSTAALTAADILGFNIAYE